MSAPVEVTREKVAVGAVGFDPLAGPSPAEREAAAAAAAEEAAEKERQAAIDQSSLDWWMKQKPTEAGDLLLKKAMVLLGVSKELGEDSERGKLLKHEADELMAFATEIQQSDHATAAVEGAHALMSELNKKYSVYESQTAGLRDESIKLWTSVSSSKEADDLVKQSHNLLLNWAKYAQTSDGQALLGQAQGLLHDNVKGGDIISLIDAHALDENGKPVIQKDKLHALTAQVTDVGTALHSELVNDSDVAELIAKAQRDLGATATNAQSLAHSTLIDEAKDGPVGDMSDEQKNTVAIMKGEQYLRDLRQNELGKKLIAQGTAYIASGQLNPEQILAMGNNMYNDGEGRQVFINKVKDSALEFLMAYLPTAHIPPIEGQQDNIEYKLTNIDLSGFKVLSQDVEVLLSEEDGLQIKAENISCAMGDLGYKFKRHGIINVSGEGKAEAVAQGVKFFMRLELEVMGKKLKSPKAKSPKSPAIKSPSASASGAASPEKKPTTPTGEAAARKKPATPKSTTRTPSTSSSPSAPSTKDSAAAMKTQKPKTSAASKAEAKAAPPPLKVDGSPTVSAPTSPSSSDPPMMKLKLTECRITMDKFKINILSGKNKWIYNFLLTLFQSKVRAYIEEQMNQVINEQSGQLLGTVNNLAVDYLPLLYRILHKADAVVKKKTGVSIIEKTTTMTGTGPIIEEITSANTEETGLTTAPTSSAASSADTANLDPLGAMHK